MTHFSDWIEFKAVLAYFRCVSERMGSFGALLIVSHFSYIQHFLGVEKTWLWSDGITGVALTEWPFLWFTIYKINPKKRARLFASISMFLAINQFCKSVLNFHLVVFFWHINHPGDSGISIIVLDYFSNFQKITVSKLEIIARWFIA